MRIQTGFQALRKGQKYKTNKNKHETIIATEVHINILKSFLLKIKAIETKQIVIGCIASSAR